MSPVDPAAPPPSGLDSRVQARLEVLERKINSLESFINGGASGQFPVVSSLPTAGRKGRVVFNSSDSKVYVDTGSAWVAQT